jgi:hypothetical protein
MAIKGVHALFFSDKADELRVFMRDKLGIAARDVGGGWLIFDFQEADMGVHPTDPKGGPPTGVHDISFYCDDLEQTVAELKAKGVAFDEEIQKQDWGFTTRLTMPGEVKVTLYQPRY